MMLHGCDSETEGAEGGGGTGVRLRGEFYRTVQHHSETRTTGTGPEPAEVSIRSKTWDGRVLLVKSEDLKSDSKFISSLKLFYSVSDETEKLPASGTFGIF